MNWYLLTFQWVIWPTYPIQLFQPLFIWIQTWRATWILSKQPIFNSPPILHQFSTEYTFLGHALQGPYSYEYPNRIRPKAWSLMRRRVCFRLGQILDETLAKSWPPRPGPRLFVTRFQIIWRRSAEHRSWPERCQRSISCLKTSVLPSKSSSHQRSAQ